MLPGLYDDVLPGRAVGRAAWLLLD
jgi:hypothetical protein